ncbi:hypothetical protein KIN20_006725 [Parelaphostrongylus tenuis]|uniref:Uncharacterized protein n=1 Tax=Parelaphostrongylus tenuis TaxID=148309 RepID=A0AAD5QH46_PARTN|nr:hypothetical protein KIN20_006725 [Parelaphostrongylus tenuis]
MDGQTDGTDVKGGPANDSTLTPRQVTQPLVAALATKGGGSRGGCNGSAEVVVLTASYPITL